MATQIIYIVLRFQLHLRTAQQIKKGGKRTRPRFSWAEKIPQDQSFGPHGDASSICEEVELVATNGTQWKAMLVHSKSCEEDVRVSCHNPIKEVARQHLVDEVKKHLGEFKEAGTKVTEDPESLWDVSELNDHMMYSMFYVVHQPMTLDDGTKSVMTRYWWEVVAVRFGN